MTADLMHAFLLIGQSNMAGRGAIEAEDRVALPRVFAQDAAMRWQPAADPIHYDKPRSAGVGPGRAFAREVARARPGWTIGLVPAAVGGSALDAWRPSSPLYTDAVARVRSAMRSGARLTALLWHQGESDQTPEQATSYARRFTGMIGQLRADLSAADIPVLVGQLGEFAPAARLLNPELLKLPGILPGCHIVSSAGLTHIGDRLHFDAASARELGRRYAKAFLEIEPSRRLRA